MKHLKKYQQSFELALKDFIKNKEPNGLYSPINYLVSQGGKRLRPVLVLMASDIFGKKLEKAISAALAIEIFHNFTLMHDDIMDAAPLRRGLPTVHHKWNLNTGILSGDAMLIQAYQSLEGYDDILYGKLIRLLSQTAMQVCEGQQYDIDFESQHKVSQDNYLRMIRLKTGVLLGCALKMGAWIGEAKHNDSKAIYDFGVLLGIAFQIKDDYLDAFGNPSSFGKQLGGDIIENKKTILFHLAMSMGSIAEQNQLKKWFASPIQRVNANNKIKAVKNIFDSTGASKACQNLVTHYTESAFENILTLDIEDKGKKLFKAFGIYLMNRQF